MEVVDWIRTHWQLIAELGAALWTIASVVVAMTPTHADDVFLAKVANRLSFLKPSNVGGLLSLPGKLEKPDDDRKGPPLGPGAILAFVAADFAARSGAL